MYAKITAATTATAVATIIITATTIETNKNNNNWLTVKRQSNAVCAAFDLQFVKCLSGALVSIDPSLSFPTIILPSQSPISPLSLPFICPFSYLSLSSQPRP